jgi:hypothetical protein
MTGEATTATRASRVARANRTDRERADEGTADSRVGDDTLDNE